MVPFTRVLRPVTALASLMVKFLLITTDAAPDKIVSPAIAAWVAIVPPPSITLYLVPLARLVRLLSVVASARVRLGVVLSVNVTVAAFLSTSAISSRAWAIIVLAVSLTLNLTPEASVTLGSVVVSTKISLIDNDGFVVSVMTTVCILAAVTAV